MRQYEEAALRCVMKGKGRGEGATKKVRRRVPGAVCGEGRGGAVWGEVGWGGVGVVRAATPTWPERQGQHAAPRSLGMDFPKAEHL